MASISKEYRAIRLALHRLGMEGIEKQTLSIEEAARQIGTTKAEVRRLIASGVLRRVYVGREKRIPTYLVQGLRRT